MSNKHSIIVCTPSSSSFNMAVARRYAATVREAGDTAQIRDLYGFKFDPVLTLAESRGSIGPAVKEEMQILADTDVFVLVYPIWFGAPPAMLKGYIDRVLGAGFSYREIAANKTQPLLRGKRLISFTSSGGMRAWLEERGIMMSMRNLFDRYLAEIFSLHETRQFHFDGVRDGMKDWEVGMHLRNVEEAAQEVLQSLHSQPIAPRVEDPPPVKHEARSRDGAIPQ